VDAKIEPEVLFVGKSRLNVDAQAHFPARPEPYLCAVNDDGRHLDGPVLRPMVLPGDRDAVRLDLTLAFLSAGSLGRWVAVQTGGVGEEGTRDDQDRERNGSMHQCVHGAFCRVESPSPLKVSVLVLKQA